MPSPCHTRSDRPPVGDGRRPDPPRPYWRGPLHPSMPRLRPLLLLALLALAPAAPAQDAPAVLPLRERARAPRPAGWRTASTRSSPPSCAARTWTCGSSPGASTTRTPSCGRCSRPRGSRPGAGRSSCSTTGATPSSGWPGRAATTSAPFGARVGPRGAARPVGPARRDRRRARPGADRPELLRDVGARRRAGGDGGRGPRGGAPRALPRPGRLRRAAGGRLARDADAGRARRLPARRPPRAARAARGAVGGRDHARRHDKRRPRVVVPPARRGAGADRVVPPRRVRPAGRGAGAARATFPPAPTPT